MSSIDPQKLQVVLVTDCGSTTTKALLFERMADGWHQTCRGEAPTTVEEPVADVTVGALNAVTEIEELSGRRILDPTALVQGLVPFLPRSADGRNGLDLYLSTSSAGGGLQMLVMGVVRQMTTESAERAALGAGAIVLDAISADDGREDHERVERIRHLRPDIVLLCGGIDSGSRSHVIEMAEMLLAASPRPRFGDTLRLPVIYAGNSEAAAEVQEILGGMAQISVVENVRPVLERENLGPAREAIHEFFLKHVMSHSPGYSRLLSWTPLPVMPTPAAVGDMVRTYAISQNLQVLCVDIGGATSDVFSVFRNQAGEPVFNRTVSANLGMSYSIANVLVEAGVDAIARWLPCRIETTDLRDRLRNKMIRPTSIPQSMEDLWLEQAVCREALRLSLQHHRSLAVGLSGVQRQRGIADIFAQGKSRYELVDMMKLDVVIGSGGVLSHAPERIQAMLMMLEGFGLCGLTQITVDSIFMLPHLGVFSALHPAAAAEIFGRDCLINLGWSLVPVFPAGIPAGTPLAEVLIDDRPKFTIKKGEVSRAEFEPDQKVKLKLVPLHKAVDLGAGAGEASERTLDMGQCGLLMDGRNRPIEFAGDSVSAQKQIYQRIGLI